MWWILQFIFGLLEGRFRENNHDHVVLDKVLQTENVGVHMFPWIELIFIYLLLQNDSTHFLYTLTYLHPYNSSHF